MKINIPFRGISNVPDDSYSKDGEMAVVMNMRHKGGELVECRPPTVEINDAVKTLYHAQSGKWLDMSDDHDLFVRGELTPLAKDVKNFGLMGNVVLLNKSNQAEYLIWRGGVYEYLGTFPEVPEMSIGLNYVLEFGETVSKYSYEYLDRKTAWAKVAKGYFDMALDKHYKSRRFVDNVLFVVGLRLFDGSYIYSHLYYVRGNGAKDVGSLKVESGVNNFATFINTGGNGEATMGACVLGFDTEFTFKYNLEKWEDIVSSVDVFTSGSLMEHEVANLVLEMNEGGLTVNLVETNIEAYTNKSIPKLRDEIENCSAFYRIASYDLKGNLLYNVMDTSPSSLAVQQMLPVSNLKRYNAADVLNYNSKLHITNYEEKINFATPGMLDAYYPEVGGLGPNKSLIEIDMKMRMKNGAVKSITYDYTDAVMGNQAGISLEHLTSLVSHPARDIVEMQGVFMSNGKKNYISTLLKNHPIMDMSLSLLGNTTRNYFVDYKIVGAFNNTYNANSQKFTNVTFDPVTFLDKIGDGVKSEYELKVQNDTLWTLKEGDSVIASGMSLETSAEYGFFFTGDVIPGTKIIISITGRECSYDISSLVIQSEVEEMEGKDIDEVQKNTLKVSAVDNPFYFPTAQAYKFEGDIVALSSNAEAISTGQFGQFPLFVFTTEGIWAMSVDTSGKGAYLAQSPFSREVCSGSVCPLSGGVAFTTERGVMLISGGQVTELTENLDGLAVDFMEYQADTWEKIFERAEMDYYVQPVPIQEYVKGAKLAYNYKHNELMLSNYAFPFTYVLNLKDGTWGMIDTTFDLTTNKYPECVVHNSEKGERYVFEDADGCDVRVVAVTRPVKVETLDFKRIRQAALRCTFIGKLNFYVLGSNDGARFVCITGKEYPSKYGNEPTDVMRRDLITSAARSKQYKYISVVVAGVMRGRVSLAEMLVEGGFASNQLR